MALDPVAAALVQTLTDGFPDIGAEGIDAVEARRVLAEAPEPPWEPTEVAQVEDRRIPGRDTAREIPVRIYWPVDGTSGLAVVVFFHGGGFTLCNLDTHDRMCRDLCRDANAVVVSVDYRLAPEHPYPAAVEDAYAAVCWAADHAHELGGDAARLSVAGDSTGGNLAAVAALVARDRGGPSIAFQLLIYPVTDSRMATPSYRENGEGFFLTREHMRWYWTQYLTDPADGDQPYASPLRAPDLSGLPPAHIITAEHDPLRDEGEAYGARLRDAGVAVTVRRVEGAFHGFFGFGQVWDIASATASETFGVLRAGLER